MTEATRALTLTPEWAWAVTHLDKRVENRTWRPSPTLIGQRIAIHAGRSGSDIGAVELMAGCARWRVNRIGHRFEKPGRVVFWPGRSLVRGAIVAVATLAGVREVDEREAVGWEVGPFCLDLADVVVLPTPIPAKGALGLWRLNDEQLVALDAYWSAS